MDTEGWFSTGHIVTIGVVLVVAGMAMPAMRQGGISGLFSHLTGTVETVADRSPIARPLSGVSTEAKTIATRSRLRGIKGELNIWASKFGPPKASDLDDAVGADTAKDAWGRPVQFQPPNPQGAGWLRSLGADGKPSKDDITLPVTMDDVDEHP